jgi:hypothetical protein
MRKARLLMSRCCLRSADPTASGTAAGAPKCAAPSAPPLETLMRAARPQQKQTNVQVVRIRVQNLRKKKAPHSTKSAREFSGRVLYPKHRKVAAELAVKSPQTPESSLTFELREENILVL